MKLQNKILKNIIPVIVFFVSVLGIGSFLYTKNNIENDIYIDNLNLINKLKSSFLSYQNQRIRELKFLSSTKEIRGFQESKGLNKYSFNQTELISILDSLFVKEERLKEVYFINYDGDIIFDYSRDIFYNAKKDQDIIKDIIFDDNFSNKESFFIPINSSVGERVFYFLKDSRNKQYIILSEDYSFFSTFFNKEESFNSYFILTNKNKDILLNKNLIKFEEFKHENILKEDLLPLKIENNKLFNINEKNYIVYQEKFGDYFNILLLHPSKLINYEISFLILIIICFVILLSLSVTFMLFFSMKSVVIKPINKIKTISEDIKDGYMERLNIDINEEFNDNNELSELAHSIYDMSQNLIKSNAQVNKIAYFDYLTNLPNKRHFEQELKEKVKVASFNLEEVCVMLLDLDDFKEINDMFGHSIGDEFLKSIAKKLENIIQKTKKSLDEDFNCELSRLGGDDFVILLKGKNLEEISKIITKNILTQLADKIILEDKTIYPSASIGISLYPKHTEDYKKLFQYADMAMYAAKSEGKNQYSYINEEILFQKRDQEQLNKDIKEALSNDDFILHFQPKYNIEKDNFKHFEALIRWIHKDKGFISPGVFIPFAEKSNLIVKIGDWVINEVCEKVRTLEESGWIDFKISFNVSYKQLQEVQFVEKLQKTIKKKNINPKHLEMEITEYAIVKDLDQALLDLERVRKLGVSVSLDDFGTGYSSLIYLQSLPLDILKIDRAFVSKSVTSPESLAIIKTIITLAQGLGLKTVAEGVETKEEYELLKSLGCDFVQGYYFYKPLKFGEILEVYKK